MTENSSRQKIDLRGLPCPQPVLKAKKLLDDPNTNAVEALVDDQVNVQNLTRLARSLKCSVSVTSESDGFCVLIARAESITDPALLKDKVVQNEAGVDHFHAKEPEGSPLSSIGNGTIVVISKDKFGDGDPEFSTNLLNVFLQTLFEAGHRPQAILMLNSGVKLFSENSPFEKVLKDFQESGVEVLACGLCVEFYGLKQVVPKEQITNMFAICEYINAAAKIISP
jgi:selenium metabolism protein YedF